MKNVTIEEAAADAGFVIPQPLPTNIRAWSAFLRVRMCRHAPMGVPYVPIWSDIESVLRLHDMWSIDVQTRLEVCFTELLVMEQEKRDADGGR